MEINLNKYLINKYIFNKFFLINKLYKKILYYKKSFILFQKIFISHNLINNYLKNINFKYLFLINIFKE